MGLTSKYLSPKVQIFYNGVDKTSSMDWISISITDNEGKDTDKLNITLGYGSPAPRFKDTIDIYVDSFFLGHFIIATIKTKYKRSYDIEAIAADFMSSLKDRKSRSHVKLSYRQIIENIAKEHGLNVKINFERSNEVVELEQHDMSDAAFCEKIANDLDLTFSIKNKTMIFIDRDKVTDRVEYDLSEDDYLELNFEQTEVTNYASCEVTWRDTKAGQDKVTVAGSGTPVLKRQIFSADSEAEALKIAQSYLQNKQNSSFKGNVRCMGVPFFAGGYLNLQINGETKRAIIKKITHTINKAWISDIEFF